MVINGIAYKALVRFSVIDSTDLVKTATKKHNLSPITSVALGRLLTGIALMVPWLSKNDTLTYIIEGSNKIKYIAAQSKNNGNVRGYILPKIVDTITNEKGKFDLKSAIGNGTLKVVRDLGLKTPYVTPIKLISGEIAEDLTYYFTISEQIPSAIALGVLVDKNGIKRAGGIIIQILDQSLPKKDITEIEKKFKEITPITNFLEKHTPIDALKHIFGKKIEKTETHEINFRCSCSHQKALESLKLLKVDELKEIIIKNEIVEVSCKWCSTTYKIKPEEVKKILEEKNK
ncbi:molecular chaperone Hsp33 [Thermosipho melanesiensis]|uniref:33 kDa chaperonin n=2 Tax=Thermosipho melanesiensis TaxID=46541 RepID=HSLO_THEM4|nr:RecName: Full=33 kDa chaperonin; AltName: Full=Heat shock protein 33 homolog; Short=HSP33 [Thermosipho melanesiensis BI429]APT73374.1 molecular chaperone Hsp33 [Thermosipho melanesiensis]ABR30174.1 Hsp33 protein [Thermosipho melanesiensis BI429]OOC38189.1 molecular chaperone Hsp33 [Thermosipho melanesiensis]OOC40110.1 molecular chaperone Hsp33 [Thermosipho melanesiensis]OOC40162.1 molecular chaperone Hsp33 [Thermosipho melanesiensis]